MRADCIELDVLGPVRARRGPHRLALRGTRQQLLLLRLVVERGGSVSATQLRHDIWPDTTVSASTLRVAIARLRQALLDDGEASPAIVRDGLGYAIAPDLFDLDARRFESWVARGCAEVATQPGRAAGLLREALTLWRGEPFGGLDDSEPLHVESERLRALRRRALESCFEAEVAVGYGVAVVDEIAAAVDADPLSESLVASLAIALYRSGRQVEALAAYRRLERELRDELGLQPSPRLQNLQHQILNHADELSYVPQHDAGRPVPAITERFLRLGDTAFVGRSEELTSLHALAGRAGQSSTRVARVVGPPGSGKTHLMAAAAQWADDSGARVVYTACGDGSASDAQLVFDLAQGLDLDLRAASESLTDPATRTFEIRASVIRRLEDLSARHDVMVVADDLQGIDDEIASFLGFVIERSPSGVTWLLGYRCDAGRPSLARLVERVEHSVPTVDIVLAPFEEHEIKELAVHFGRGDEDLDELISLVHEQSGGNPLLCVELLRDTRRRSLDGVSDRLATLIGGRLASVSETARHVATALVVAGREVPVAIIGEVCGVDDHAVVVAAEQLAANGILERPDSERLRIRHGLIATALRAEVSDAQSATLRRRFVDVLRDDHSSVGLLAELLLSLPYPHEESERQLIDRATAAALEGLLWTFDYGGARELANRYLGVVGTDRSAPDAMKVLLLAATVLLANDDTERGWALHRIVVDRTTVVDDPTVRADALLAVGPVALGGASAPDQIRQAEALLEALPADEHRRRVQLLCWAAHHHVNLGALDPAIDVLDQARRELASSPSSTLSGLELSVRAQAARLVSHPYPSDVYATLSDHAALTGDLVASAGVALLGVGEAFTTGSIDDVQCARRRLAEIADLMPRSDLLWTSAATDAAMHLATGDFDAATAGIADAEATGRASRVDMAEPVARLQQALLLFQTDQLGGLVELVVALADRPDPAPIAVAIAGVAALQAGDSSTALTMLERLATIERMLESSAQTWPAVASYGARLAAGSGESDLAAVIRDQLAPHLRPRRGCALALHGIAYFGTVDLALAFLDEPVPRGARGTAFELAAALEGERGMTWWEADARRARPSTSAGG